MRAKRHPLIPAILSNDYQAAKQLLRDMTAFDLADIRVSPLNALANEDIDYTKMPFLVWAVIAADSDIFEKLLNKANDVNPRFIRPEIVETPLSFAIKHLPNTYQNAMLLIKDKRTNVNWISNTSILLSLCFDYDRNNPVEKQTHLYSMILLQELLERLDLHVNAPGHLYNGTTALMFAAQNGLADAVGILLKHPKIDASRKDVWDKSAFDYAADNKEIKRLLRQHKHRLIDQTPLLQGKEFPQEFDIAVDISYKKRAAEEKQWTPEEKQRNAPYERTVLTAPLPAVRPNNSWQPSTLFEFDSTGQNLKPLDFNNKSLGVFKFTTVEHHDMLMIETLQKDYEYAKKLIDTITLAHDIYSAIDESDFSDVGKATLFKARETYIVPMIQAIRDTLPHGEALSSLTSASRRHSLREWAYMLDYCRGNVQYANAATLYHRQGGYPLLYMFYKDAGGGAVNLIGWVRSLNGAARSNTVRESIGALALSLFIAALEQKRNGPIHYIFMESLLGTDKVLRKISEETQEDLILYKLTVTTVPAWYNGKDSDCLVVTDALRNYYKQALTVKESKSKRSKVEFCISCHVGEAYRPLYRPEGGPEGHVFCGEECYKHYFDGHYLH